MLTSTALSTSHLRKANSAFSEFFVIAQEIACAKFASLELGVLASLRSLALSSYPTLSFLASISNLLFSKYHPYQKKTNVALTQSPAGIDYNHSFETIMRIFDETNSWNLPLIKQGIFAGIISKSMLYNEYRKLMLQLSDD